MNKWLLTILVVAAFTGCRRGPALGPDEFGPAYISPEWEGGVGLVDDDLMMGERFGYAGVIDVQFEHVLFGFDSSQVAPGEQSKLNAVAAYMRESPDVKLIVEGHTCDIGSREYNMALGERRALAARAFLVQSGIDPARIQTRSFGKERPAQSGVGEAARRINRRADFVMVL